MGLSNVRELYREAMAFAQGLKDGAMGKYVPSEIGTQEITHPWAVVTYLQKKYIGAIPTIYMGSNEGKRCARSRFQEHDASLRTCIQFLRFDFGEEEGPDK